ncbi:MAG: hypothetical protein ABSG83_11025 [Roseiarcus sp.]|jgi:hypothetical protein
MGAFIGYFFYPKRAQSMTLPRRGIRLYQRQASSVFPERATKMSSAAANSHVSRDVISRAGVGRIGAIGKHILNELSTLANRPAEHRRLAALSPRLLEDIGMTVAERDALTR